MTADSKPRLWEPKPNWEVIAKRVRERIVAAIPASYYVDASLLPKSHDEPVLDLPARSGVLSPRELEITVLNAYELLPKIADKTYTSVEVATAFCKRATIAHQVTNCIAHVMFEDALNRAAELDEHLERTGSTFGPLHGLPISVKEHVELRGTPATAGFIAWADDVSEKDALIIKILRDAGAIFHVKTTNPQALMAIETNSNIYGRTTNPHNRALTCGGSSGGEGALIAMRGSILGVGTDMGGSIRVPAAMSGVYGLKPSIARNPHGGLAGNYGGMENIVGVVGPLATCVQDLRIFQEVVLAAEPWNHEPSLVRIPWNPEGKDMQLSKKLKIGVVWSDGVVQPHPPVMRALKTTVEALRSAGHEVIDWDTSLHEEIQNILWKMFFLDAGEDVLAVLETGKEGPVDSIETALKGGPFTRPRAYAIDETWKINSRRNTLQTIYAEMWNSTGIDFILAPANPAAAAAHNETKWDGYTGVWNLLDYSAVTFPVTYVQELDTYDSIPRLSEGPLGPRDAQCIEQYEKGPNKYIHAPVALQVVTRRHTEEKVLKVVEEVQRILSTNKML